LKTFQKARYGIDVVGLSSDAFINVTIDSDLLAYQHHPGYTIYLIPYRKKKHPAFEKVFFYANCVAYILDLPTMPHLPATEFNKYFQKPIFYDKQVHNRDYYKFNFIATLEYITRIRLGFCSVHFNVEMEKTNLELTAKYRKAADELQLYGGALKQLDILGEYLNYFRVIESVTKNSGVAWIKNAIPKIRNYDYGIIKASDFENKNKKNLLQLYKNKALRRIKSLRTKYQTNEGLAKYLYINNRCGIAHGKENLRYMDFGSDYFEVAKDCVILKMLARMAIEEKISAK